jgi:hypothetical protein
VSHLKIFSRTKGPILTRLGTNHPWGEGIEVCTYEGDCPSPRGDNSKRVFFFKILFSKTSWPKLIKLGTDCSWVKGMQVCSNRGLGPLQREDNHKNVKIRRDLLKIFSRTTGVILTLW